VFLLNVDTILERNCLKNLYEFAESKDDVACISPRIVEYTEFLNGKIERGYPLIFDIKDGLIKAYDVNEDYMEVSFVPGTALFANLEKLRGNLYFREDFFIYHEDVEFSLRVLTQTDLKLYFLNNAIVAHDSKQSFSRTYTCRLALRNLFTCLVTYQDKREFFSNYLNYVKSLFKMYKNFYSKYYPITYPVLSIFYLVTSILKTHKQTNFNLSRLHEINQKVSRYRKQFEFIF
jgi:GT2 family glycosyltransferase